MQPATAPQNFATSKPMAQVSYDFNSQYYQQYPYQGGYDNQYYGYDQNYVANTSPVLQAYQPEGVPQTTYLGQYQNYSMQFPGSFGQSEMPQEQAQPLRPSSHTAPRQKTRKYSPTQTQKTELCRALLNHQPCAWAETCKFAHSFAEVQPRRLDTKYKTQKCTSWQESRECNFDDRCAFLHDEKAVILPTGMRQLRLDAQNLVREEVSPAVWVWKPLNNQCVIPMGDSNHPAKDGAPKSGKPTQVAPQQMAHGNHALEGQKPLVVADKTEAKPGVNQQSDAAPSRAPYMPLYHSSHATWLDQQRRALQGSATNDHSQQLMARGPQRVQSPLAPTQPTQPIEQALPSRAVSTKSPVSNLVGPSSSIQSSNTSDAYGAFASPFAPQQAFSGKENTVREPVPEPANTNDSSDLGGLSSEFGEKLVLGGGELLPGVRLPPALMRRARSA